jgi:hypothetical protein
VGGRGREEVIEYIKKPKVRMGETKSVWQAIKSKNPREDGA